MTFPAFGHIPFERFQSKTRHSFGAHRSGCVGAPAIVPAWAASWPIGLLSRQRLDPRAHLGADLCLCAHGVLPPAIFPLRGPPLAETVP